MNMNLKIALMLFAMTLALRTQAAEVLVKTCATEIKFVGDARTIPTLIQIFMLDPKNFKATVHQTMNGVTSTRDHVTTIEVFPVRSGLEPSLSFDGLNAGERLIMHALLVTENPTYSGTYSAGFDLRAARYVRVYEMQTTGAKVVTALIEAKDGEGKDLGTFLGGYLIGPCK